MKNNKSLKKQIASILDDARSTSERANPLTGDIYVSERVNEHGYKCTYRFSEEMKDELLKRADRFNRKPAEKNGGLAFQKGLLFLKENTGVLQTLFDIQHLIGSYKYTAQDACRILFKDKKGLPLGFCKKGPYYYMSMDYSHSIDYYVRLLPMVPKAWLKGIEI